jgi:hypothetical protein
METMDSCETGKARISWPLVRIAALVLIVLAFGFAGLEAGVRTLGGILLFFAAAQLLRRLYGVRTGCEIPGQVSILPALMLAGAQAGAGVVLLGWPGAILNVMGIEAP